LGRRALVPTITGSWQIKECNVCGKGAGMNELARFVRFSLGFTQNYRIVDRDGNPWFAVKDICKILGIKNPSKAVRDFPKTYVSMITTITSSYSGENRPIPHKLLIINEAGLYRLITRSSKPVARKLQDKIFGEILPAYRKHGINWAALPRAWKYRGEWLNHAEWMAKKEAAYFRRFPDKDYDDFLRSLPPYPPDPEPEAGEKAVSG
jgi:prophage antirepressor-like protein